MKDFIEILKIIVWPLVTLMLAMRFRHAIEALIPGAKIKFKLAGIEVETTLKEFTTVIQETYRHGELTDKQWVWLERLKKEGKIPYNHQTDYHDLRPLRNSGLIREHPEGWLSNCQSVSITPLGEFLLKNKNA
jgi:hypothetical protein